MARRLRQVVDLYTTGKVVPLRDGSPVWVQALNPFEQDTARNEAQIAKARLTLAIREFGSDEQAKVRMFFFEHGVDAARKMLIEAKVAEATPTLFEKIRNDPDWAERLQILDRGTDETATPLEEGEVELLTKISHEFAAEIGARVASEREFLTQQYAEAEESFLFDEYLNWYVDRRANEVLMAEFRLHQIFYGVRWCEAIDRGNGTYDHAGCDHTQRVFDTKDEARNAPQELLETLGAAVDEIEMSARDAKNSHRQGSSSDSSPLPSEAEESTASTPAETPAVPPGSWSSPSPTPSPSSASES